MRKTTSIKFLLVEALHCNVSTAFALLIGLFVIFASACSPTVQEVPEPYSLNIQAGFPVPEIPEDNQLTQTRVDLGKKLFFEKALSLDSSISCGSCHKQELAFTDGKPISIGIKNREGFRNSPTLANMAWQPYFFAEGGSPSLKMQMVGPIEEHNEMGFNFALAIKRLAQAPEYQRLAQEAYEREFDAFVLMRAVAAFERTLISGNSPFDQFFYQNKPDAMSQEAKRGWEVFSSEKANCTSCHPAPLFSDFSIQNIGLENYENDLGLYRKTVDSADIGKFKVPSLRNIALTAPYMHDGGIPSLDQVIEHFNQGGHNHPNQSEKVRPLNLSEGEKSDLLAFLNSLTDTEFIQNPAFVP
jgi:cytochrome c peroxidase